MRYYRRSWVSRRYSRGSERDTVPVRTGTILDPVPEVVATLDGLLACAQRGVSVIPPKLRGFVL